MPTVSQRSWWIKGLSRALGLPAGTCILAALLFSAARAQDSWMLGPFSRIDSVNPCLAPGAASRFVCPIRARVVEWEAKDIFNPAAVVRDGRVYLLYRAQDRIGNPAGTSRIGLAWSRDGLRFEKRPDPVLFPDNDFMKEYEWEGGCEDPRIVQDESGGYIMTYTAFDSHLARLAVATSTDLVHWKKEGLAFDQARDGKYRDTWSKSGSIVTMLKGDALVATRIGGRYWMYWGESDIFAATSDDLIHWLPIEAENGQPAAVLERRRDSFDSRLVEPGPPALLTGAGVVFIYNSSNMKPGGDPQLPAGTYAAGQALFAKDNPTQLLARSPGYFFHPEREYEREGQVRNVCFLEGLVHFNGRWLLYYGTADSRIAVAATSQ